MFPRFCRKCQWTMFALPKTNNLSYSSAMHCISARCISCVSKTCIFTWDHSFSTGAKFSKKIALLTSAYQAVENMFCTYKMDILLLFANCSLIRITAKPIRITAKYHLAFECYFLKIIAEKKLMHYWLSTFETLIT